VDTDVGTNPDDGVALLLAQAHPAIELVGVSTVSGDTAVRARVARAYVPGVPVVAGAERPNGQGPEPRWLGYEGEGPLGEAATATQELADAVSEARPDVLIAIGPLTNVAALLEAGVRPKRIIAMAGITKPVWHRGQLVEVDHNTASDPGAARRVSDEENLLMVPLDVTIAMRCTDRDAAVLAARHPRLRHEVSAWLTRADAVVLHDPLAVLAAVPDEDDRIGLETKGRQVTSVDGPRAIRRVMTLLAQEPR
jgi:purine nucleosidase